MFGYSMNVYSWSYIQPTCFNNTRIIFNVKNFEFKNGNGSKNKFAEQKLRLGFISFLQTSFVFSVLFSKVFFY